MAEYDPAKWNLMHCWKYATRSGVVEEEGDPLPRFVEGDAYLLVEKKEYNDEVTYWGTLYESVSQVVRYTTSLGYKGPGTTSDMGWSIAYLFDLNTGDPLRTDFATQNRAYSL
jgi:hypothetical protein